MNMQCRHIMPNGLKCRAIALKYQPFCYFHNRMHGFASRPAPAPGEPLKLPFLEDRSSIRIALAQILDGLGSAQLDPRRAGLFLYALQIATQNVDRKHDIVPKESVHSVTRTAAGDELGPEAGFCDIPDDCDTCPERDTCEDCPTEDEEDDEDED